MATYRTGGEVDALCTRCRMVLAHTILAMVGSRPVRVQCNTCNGQHNYHAAGDAAPALRRAAAAPGEAREARPARVTVTFEDALASRQTPPRTYGASQSYALDDVVVHPAFGRGWVSAVRPGKIDVTFKAGVKTLVAGKK